MNCAKEDPVPTTTYTEATEQNTELGEEQLKVKDIMQKLLQIQKEIPNIAVIQAIIEEPRMLNLFVSEEDPSKIVKEMKKSLICLIAII